MIFLYVKFRHFLNWLKKSYIKFIHFLNGEGFVMSEPSPKSQSLYNYYKAIANNEPVNTIQAYEDEINKLKEEYPRLTREEIINTYINSLEWVYGKEQF